jgi:hypothetical protein
LTRSWGADSEAGETGSKPANRVFFWTMDATPRVLQDSFEAMVSPISLVLTFAMPWLRIS